MKGRAVAWGLALIAAGATVVALLEAMAVRVVAGNSDSATAVLEGSSIAHGHPLLQGWRLSLDSFWTIDALANALGVALGGVRPELMRAVPVALATAVIVVGVAIGTYGLTGRGRIVAASVVLAILALPSRALGQFFLQGPYHVGTALYCLGAFAAVATGRGLWRTAAAIVLLAAGILGDFQTLLLGVLPIVAVGVFDGRRERRLAAALPLVGAGVGGVTLALVVRAIARAAGGFAATKANTLASKGQMVRNVIHLPNEALALLGLTGGPFGPTGVPVVLMAMHVVGVALVAVAVGACWRRVVREVRTPPGTAATTPDRLATLLGCAVIGDLATFVLLPITSSEAYGRYLTAGVIFAAILTARTVGTWASRAHDRRAPLAVVGTVGVVAVASFALAVRGPAPPLPARQLATFLAAHHLDQGIGDYWSSTIVTVQSRGRVAVRPVVADAGTLVRYGKQSESAWYADRAFSFYVYDSAFIWNGDDRAIAVATFGRPAHTYPVGTYRVLVWPRAVHVGTVGSDGP